MAQTLDNLTAKAAPASAVEAGPSSPYVDYDTIYVDRLDGSKIFGNWRATPTLACSDKAVNSYQIRSKLKNYNFDSACAGSINGIWLFQF